MNSSSKAADNEVLSAIPPVITNNPREKIEPEAIHVSDIFKYNKESLDHLRHSVESVIGVNAEKRIPAPRYPLSMIWSPGIVLFEIENEVILNKVRIWNACGRSIYIRCCALWGDTARLGAKWRCYPRTRFFLAPGLTAEIIIKATPREESPVPSAKLAVQLAAAYNKDLVVGYFVIPVVIKFHNYIKPCLGETE